MRASVQVAAEKKRVAKAITKAESKGAVRGKGTNAVVSKTSVSPAKGGGKAAGRPKGKSKGKGKGEVYQGPSSIYMPAVSAGNVDSEYIKMTELQSRLECMPQKAYKTCGVMEGPIAVQGFAKKKGGGMIMVGGFVMTCDGEVQVFKVRHSNFCLVSVISCVEGPLVRNALLPSMLCRLSMTMWRCLMKLRSVCKDRSALILCVSLVLRAEFIQDVSVRVLEI